MFGIGMGEWTIIFLIILLLFGAKRLPEIARALGKATSEFKKAKDDLTSYDASEASKKGSSDERQEPKA